MDSDHPRSHVRRSAAATSQGTSGKPTRLASPAAVSSTPACAVAPRPSGANCPGPCSVQPAKLVRDRRSVDVSTGSTFSPAAPRLGGPQRQPGKVGAARRFCSTLALPRIQRAVGINLRLEARQACRACMARRFAGVVRGMQAECSDSSAQRHFLRVYIHCGIVLGRHHAPQPAQSPRGITGRVANGNLRPKRVCSLSRPHVIQESVVLLGEPCLSASARSGSRSSNPRPYLELEPSSASPERHGRAMTGGRMPPAGLRPGLHRRIQERTPSSTTEQHPGSPSGKRSTAFAANGESPRPRPDRHTFSILASSGHPPRVPLT